MIKIDIHGRRWVMNKLGIESNCCPECKIPPIYINESKPYENETEYWFDSECGRCGCEWTIKYEKEIEHID